MARSDDGAEDNTNQARIAAIWIEHGRACAELLRAHGQTRHADNYDAAMGALAEIVALEVGRRELSQALAWARGHGDPAQDPFPFPTRH